MPSTFLTDSPTDAAPPSAAVSADVDAPDRVLLDLTGRQVVVLAAGAAVSFLGWHGLHTLLPVAVLIALAVPVLAGTAVLALGRRDGLPLEVWALHVGRFWRAPRRLLPARVPPPPSWAPPHRDRLTTGLLRLPARAVTPDGVLHPDRARGAARRAVMLVAASTLNLTARSPSDQASLVAGLARWLNGLSGPMQIVVAPHRVDLTVHALRIADTVHLTGDRALTEAGIDHAEFLLDLMTDRDPLARTVTVAVVGTGPDADTTARRAAGMTTASFTGLGASAAVLDGPAVTAVLTVAVDPYQPADPCSPRTPGPYPVTGCTIGAIQ